MTNSVKIIDIDQITPPVGPFSSPGDIIPLSFFDTFWVSVQPVQHIFLYPKLSDNSISLLKSSLSKTLLNFHSLSGKISYMPTTENTIIDCRRENNEGVTFIKAECENLTIEELANDPIHNAHAFEKLVPNIDSDKLPVPVLKVQLTKFVKGGLAMGIAFHHMAMDGNAFWNFIEAWSSCCRGDKAVKNGVEPVIDRALVNCRSGREEAARRFIKEIRPDFLKMKNIGTNIQSQPQVIRRTLHISTAAVERIRQDIMNKATNKNSSLTTPPSKFAVLTAIVWVCFSKAKSISSEGISVMSIALDARSYIKPSLPENYTGNCLIPLYAKIKGANLLSRNGVVDASNEVVRTLKDGMNDPLKGYEEWVKEIRRHAPSIKFRVSGSPRFMAYEIADFGWGRPKRVEVVSMNVDGCVNYFCGIEDRQVQVTVAISPLCMDEFVEQFGKFSRVGKLPSSMLSRI